MARTFDEAPFRGLQEPSVKDYAEIARDLKLSREQRLNLETSVHRALRDCASYREQRLGQSDGDLMRDKAGKISKLLIELEKEIDRGRKTVAAIAIPENLGAIGRLLSFEAVAQVTRQPTLDCPVRPELERMEKLLHPQTPSGTTQEEPGPVTLLQLEWELTAQKQLADLSSRPELLLHIVQTMRQQFDLWLEQEASDRGGAPANMARRILLHTLACDAHHIITTPIRRTGGSAFVNLCEAVLSRCGISTDGLTNAIRSHFKKTEAWAEIRHYNDLED